MPIYIYIYMYIYEDASCNNFLMHEDSFYSVEPFDMHVEGPHNKSKGVDGLPLCTIGASPRFDPPGQTPCCSSLPHV